MKTLKDIGEFGLIETIKKDFAGIAAKDKDIAVSIGDDCFCFKNGGKTFCVTKDLLVQDVHFRKEWIMPKDLGKKAVEVNVSDIASMGAVYPKYVFVGLGAPSEIPLNYIKQFYSGVKDACKKYRAQIAGGDTVKSDKIIISVTVIGESERLGKIITRNGAKTGDLIGVTNTFGDAGAGVKLLYKYGNGQRRASAPCHSGLDPESILPLKKLSKEEKYLIAKQNSPQARLKEAFVISKFANSMTDASDGLFISIGLLAKGADIDLNKIPVSNQLKKVFPDENERLRLALFGAEDYELVFTVSQNKALKLKKLLSQISYIGEIVNSNKVKYFRNGKEQKIAYAGFKHF